MILQVSWKRGHEEVNRLGCNSSGIFGRSQSPGLCFLLYHFIRFFALLTQDWTLLVKPYLHPSCVLFVVCQCDSPSLWSFKHPVPPVHGLLDLGRGQCSVSHWHLLPLGPLSPPDMLILRNFLFWPDHSFHTQSVHSSWLRIDHPTDGLTCFPFQSLLSAPAEPRIGSWDS